MKMNMIKKYGYPFLAAIIYIATLTAWFDPENIDILWTSIFNYMIIFPISGIILGIHYGRYGSNRKWILPVCLFIAVMIHDIIAGYSLFGRIEADPGQIPMYLCTAIPCLIAEGITHLITVRRRTKNQKEEP